MNKLFLILFSILAMATSAFAQLGSLDKDLVYTPVAPCRLFDTRPSQGGTGPITAAGVKNVLVWGQSSYAAQGGAPSDCGLLAAGSNVAAVAVNLTVVTPAAGGFVTAYPFGTALPTAATVNFQTGDIARGNFMVAKINQGASLFHLTIYSTSLADVVGDVVGYYSKPVSTGSLECIGTPIKTVSIAANSNLYVNANSCPTGYYTITPICDAGSASGLFMKASGLLSGNPSNAAYCSFINTSSVARDTFTASTCCRIPGR